LPRTLADIRATRLLVSGLVAIGKTLLVTNLRGAGKGQGAQRRHRGFQWNILE
jgi:hypothetical protein